MMDIPKLPQWGFFALVSYIPDPLGSFLHGIREALPGEDNPQPHITILPPRPLKLAVDDASKRARKILRRFPPFDVELSRVRFFPGTNFLYLDVGEGNGLLHALHEALNTGDLDDAEKLEFRPHLTLGGPVADARRHAAQQQAESAWRSVHHARRFTVDEVVFLWLGPTSAQGQWRRLWSQNLTGKRAGPTRLAAAAATAQTF